MLETRRTFLKQGAALAAAAGGLMGGAPVARGAVPAGGAPLQSAPAGIPETLAPFRKLTPRLKLSCAAYSYRQFLAQEKSMTLEGFIEKCAEMGLDGTELTAYYFESTEPEYLMRLKRKAFLLGLDISGTAVGNDFAKPPGPEREKEIRQVNSWIEHAARLGATCMRIFAGGVPAGKSEEEARGWVVEAIQECCETAGRHGVILALENHGGLTATAEKLLAIVNRVHSPWFGVNLDTGNFNTDDPYHDLQLAAPHAVTCQLKTEVSPRGKEKSEADLARLLGILRSVNYRGYVALEYEAKEDPRTAVPKAIERLKSLLAGPV
jgi:sugar phosphate isomerase/epimerase